MRKQLIRTRGDIVRLLAASDRYVDYDQDVIPCIGRDDLQPLEIRVVRAIETDPETARAIAAHTPKAHAIALAHAINACRMQTVLEHAKRKRMTAGAIASALDKIARTKTLQSWRNARVKAYDFRSYKRDSTYLYHVQQDGNEFLVLCMNDYDEMPVALCPGEPTVMVWAQPVAGFKTTGQPATMRLAEPLTIECTVLIRGGVRADHCIGTWCALGCPEPGTGRHRITLRNRRTRAECTVVLPAKTYALLRVMDRDGTWIYR